MRLVELVEARARVVRGMEEEEEEESSRRPAIKEPATKRPRVVEGGKRKGGSNGVAANRDCSVPPFRAPSGSGQPVAPKRTKEASQKQETNHHHHQRQEEEEEGVEELVAQYRSALADLTFNSKPMITNLSIIAGENLHAAKEIAAIICDNILAVCSEYKLPSLYLLDSITKNIGGDYVDYFAAKLPEVFCKAYKLVDSSILTSMRHLFQTWEKLFPAAPLQTIEKELGFPPTVKDSSRSTVAKPDSQRRDPPQGILVNPKYLEGRQHIHQSSRVKETASEDTKSLITPVCDAMRPDRTAVTGRLRPLMDLPLVKAEFDQRFVQQCNQQDTASRLNIEISVHSKSTKRTALVQHASMAWPMHESSLSMVSLDQNSSRNSGLLEGQPTSFSGGSSTVTNSSLSPVGLPGTAVPTSFGPITNIHSGFGQLRQQSFQTSPPSAHLLPCAPQHQKLDILTDHGQMQPLSQTPQKPMQLPVQLDQQHRPLAPGYSVLPQNNAVLPQNNAQQDLTLQNLPLHSSQPPQQLQNSSASFTQWRYCYPLLHQSHADPSLQQPHSQPQFIMLTQKQPPSSLIFETNHKRFPGTNHLSSAVNMSGQSSISNLLDVIMKSGLVFNNPANIICETLPSQVLTSSVVTSSSSSVPTSCSKMPTLKTTRPLLPPLPPGPAPSSLGGISSQISSKPGAMSSVLSSVLTSLVDKSFKSSSVTEDLTPAERPHQLPHQSSGFAGSMTMSRPSISANISDKSPLVKEHLVPEASALVSATKIQSTATESGDFISIDFKPETMCEHHSFVINALFNDLKQQCKACGLRFKLPEKLHCHLDWHASKRLELSNIGRRSRKWFTNLSCWLDGIVRPSCGTVSVTSVEELVSDGEACEPMVPADQSQVICALCGEPFEDFYSCERGEWMYRGAIHLYLPDRDGDDKSMDRILEQAVIVHAKCK